MPSERLWHRRLKIAVADASWLRMAVGWCVLQEAAGRCWLRRVAHRLTLHHALHKEEEIKQTSPYV